MIAKRQTRFCLAAIVCILAIGCQASVTPPPPSRPAAPTGDAAVLLTLDYYEPVYQVDANGHVIKLRMGGRHLSGGVMAEIGKLKELQALDLYGTNITDEGLVDLKDLQNLKALGLGGTAITDRGLTHLENLPSLRYLWLPKNSVTPEAIARLKEARPDLNVY
jgi:hypothetical protein